MWSNLIDFFCGSILSMCDNWAPFISINTLNPWFLLSCNAFLRRCIIRIDWHVLFVAVVFDNDIEMLRSLFLMILFQLLLVWRYNSFDLSNGFLLRQSRTTSIGHRCKTFSKVYWKIQVYPIGNFMQTYISINPI